MVWINGGTSPSWAIEVSISESSGLSFQVRIVSLQCVPLLSVFNLGIEWLIFSSGEKYLQGCRLNQSFQSRNRVAYLFKYFSLSVEGQKEFGVFNLVIEYLIFSSRRDAKFRTTAVETFQSRNRVSYLFKVSCNFTVLWYVLEQCFNLGIEYLIFSSKRRHANVYDLDTVSIS